uniref:Uncharacterized protein n=1 Tax=Rhizophora mucronata TaxID=61149 RepID=A0A2P2NGY3_RHIMU
MEQAQLHNFSIMPPLNSIK